MKRVLVTGAGGYVGRALAARLLAQLRGGALEALTLVDMQLDAAEASAGDARVQLVRGDLGDPAVLAQATAQRPDTVFHLAGITSRQAEDDFALGLRVNLTATVALFELLRAQAQQQGPVPVVVFASSIGVFGTPLPDRIDDHTAPAPTLSYGTQKRMVELLLADHSRRGWLDGRAVRLPSVVARPAAPSGALSAFASDLIREPAQGRRYTCPVGPEGTLWLLSLPACVECLLQAALAEAARLPAGRAWTLPALRASAGEVVQALAGRLGRDPAELVSYQPQPALQAQFAQWPPLATAVADALGQRHDGDLGTLLERALAP